MSAQMNFRLLCVLTVLRFKKDRLTLADVLTLLLYFQRRRVTNEPAPVDEDEKAIGFMSALKIPVSGEKVQFYLEMKSN